MHRTAYAIVYPDGRIGLCEEIQIDGPHRALLTILDEPPRPVPLPPDADERTRVRAILAAAGLLVDYRPSSPPRGLLDEAARVVLAQQIPPGTPLSQFTLEDRGER